MIISNTSPQAGANILIKSSLIINDWSNDGPTDFVNIFAICFDEGQKDGT